uniref:SSD domain-containing protein n=1 Tax=Gongylonema pulchrum TaxID=637853 RepID=A0A183DU36_9BILA
LLVAFSVICTFNTAFMAIPNKGISLLFVDWVSSKPLVGIIGVFVTLSAIISATGFLLLLDVPFVDIATMMPFLCLTVGIDDTFLMLVAWHGTDWKLSVEDRIEAAMRHASVSIAITSVTDATAFLIGSTASLPAVIYFCYYAAAAIIFTFCYLLSAFVAFLAIFGDWEKNGRNSLLYIKTTSSCNIENSSALQRIFNMRKCCCASNLSKCLQKSYSSMKADYCTLVFWHKQFIEKYYAPVITISWIRVLALLLFITYIVVAATGLNALQVGFDVKNLMMNDSPSKKFLELREKYFEDEMVVLEIAVLKAPDMSRKKDRVRFLNALKKLERTSCSIGRNTTQFWYFAYKHYMSELGFGDFWDILQNSKKVQLTSIKADFITFVLLCFRIGLV